jgi:2-phospho-L-lactate guanylyltransferase
VPLTAVIPLKAIRSSKTRMAGSLSQADRALLLRRTFERVAQAVGQAASISDVLVVVGDAEGRGWAREQGLASIDEPAGGHGLNAALAEADRTLGEGASMVLPADLPLVTGEDLDRVADALGDLDGVVIAPTRDGGTGALLRRPGAAIPPSFGADSAAAHQVQALRHGLLCRTLWIPGLALDLDQPGDIELAGGWSAVTGPRTLTT